MGVEVIVPVALFASIVGGVWLFQHYAAKKRLEAFNTLRLAIEKGQQVSAEAMEAMTRLSPPLADLRRGIIFLSVAGAFAALAFIFDGVERESVRPILGFAMFPLFLGLAYIGLHIFTNPKK